jgi:hypothetical protein
MNVNLHKNARTTPVIREELRTSTLGERQLAEQYNLNRATVRKWRERDTPEALPSAAYPPHDALPSPGSGGRGAA